MTSSFLPNYIHSLDGSVIRLIINNMFKKTGYIVNHLHDSVSCNPMYIKALEGVIKDIYLTLEGNIMEETLFFPNNIRMPKDSLDNIYQLQEAIEATDSKSIVSPEFNPKHLYPMD